MHHLRDRFEFKTQKILHDLSAKQRGLASKPSSLNRVVDFISKQIASNKASKNKESKVSRRSLELASESCQAMFDKSSICNVYVIENDTPFLVLILMHMSYCFLYFNN